MSTTTTMKCGTTIGTGAEAEADAEAEGGDPGEGITGIPSAPDVDGEGADAGREADGGGWPDLPGDTALTIRVPEANPLVMAGFPAHVTVLYPFLDESRLTASTDAELRELFAAQAPFTLTFSEFRRYPGVLYLPPAPDTPVRAPSPAPSPPAGPRPSRTGASSTRPSRLTSPSRTTRARRRTRRPTTSWSRGSPPPSR